MKLKRTIAALLAALALCAVLSVGASAAYTGEAYTDGNMITTIILPDGITWISEGNKVKFGTEVTQVLVNGRVVSTETRNIVKSVESGKNGETKSFTIVNRDNFAQTETVTVTYHYTWLEELWHSFVYYICFGWLWGYIY
jgi:hypothetical protein